MTTKDSRCVSGISDFDSTLIVAHKYSDVQSIFGNKNVLKLEI